MKLKTIFLTVAGFLLLALGTIGIFLPILPTTPFVLVAVVCFSGTPTLQHTITQIPFIKEYVKNYTTRQGLSKKTVVTSLLFLWVMLALSMLAISKLWLSILLVAIGTAVSIHILWMAKAKSKKAKNRGEIK